MSQLTALLLTLGIEISVAVPLVCLLGWAKRDHLLRLAIAVAAASLLSHPFAWLANTSWLTSLAFPPRAALIEVSVACFEGAFLAWIQPMRWWRGLVVGVVMNAASFGLGLLW